MEGYILKLCLMVSNVVSRGDEFTVDSLRLYYLGRLVGVSISI